jgi:dTDP-4-dehydrorhamnose reductase
MKILLIGKSGQLGWELHRCLLPLGEVVAPAREEADLARLDDLQALVRRLQPDVIVNAAAYTAVDQAEHEPESARLVNREAPGLLAAEARRLSAVLISYSTDYVFDGQAEKPYRETDAPNPLGMYGLSKLEGEQAICAQGEAYLILRTSWVYSLRRPSFVTKVLQWARLQSTLRIVSDQVSSPTWCRSLAELTAQLLGQSQGQPAGWLRARRGIYHLADAGSASRLEWAREILDLDPRKQEQQVTSLEAARSADFPTPAQRPAFSVLDCSKFTETFNLTPPHWQTSLALAMEAYA